MNLAHTLFLLGSACLEQTWFLITQSLAMGLRLLNLDTIGVLGV